MPDFLFRTEVGRDSYHRVFGLLEKIAPVLFNEFNPGVAGGTVRICRQGNHALPYIVRWIFIIGRSEKEEFSIRVV